MGLHAACGRGPLGVSPYSQTRRLEKRASFWLFAFNFHFSYGPSQSLRVTRFFVFFLACLPVEQVVNDAWVPSSVNRERRGVQSLCSRCQPRFSRDETSVCVCACVRVRISFKSLVHTVVGAGKSLICRAGPQAGNFQARRDTAGSRRYLIQASRKRDGIFKGAGNP